MGMSPYEEYLTLFNYIHSQLSRGMISQREYDKLCDAFCRIITPATDAFEPANITHAPILRHAITALRIELLRIHPELTNDIAVLLNQTRYR
jgi:hypothetical protein